MKWEVQFINTSTEKGLPALWPWSPLSLQHKWVPGTFSWEGGQGSRCIGLTLPPSCADCLEILVAPTSWNPQGMSRSVQGLFYLFHLTSR